MSLTEDQIREVQHVAWIVIERAFEKHIESCPYGKKILMGKWLAIGVIVGCSIASGSVAAVVIKMLLKV